MKRAPVSPLLSSRAWIALCVGVVFAAGCELIVDKVRDGVVQPPSNGGGSTPGGGPSPSDPGPPKQVCASSAECKPGLICSTEHGACNRPPGCDAPGAICPAVCFGTCEDEKPLPPPPPPSCEPTELAGDETTCKSVAEWKEYAYGVCKSRGLILNEYSAGGGDCGENHTRMVKFVCCKAVPAPAPVPPDAVPPPPAQSCFGAAEGDETSCKSPALWKDHASQLCSKQGAKLTDIGYGGDCGGGNYRYMKYGCCK